MVTLQRTISGHALCPNPIASPMRATLRRRRQDSARPPACTPPSRPHIAEAMGAPQEGYPERIQWLMYPPAPDGHHS